MPIPTACPSCGKTGRVPDEFQGRKVRCPRCRTRFPVQVPVVEGEIAEAVALLEEDAVDVAAGVPEEEREVLPLAETAAPDRTEPAEFSGPSFAQQVVTVVDGLLPPTAREGGRCYRDYRGIPPRKLQAAIASYAPGSSRPRSWP
jgi:hypothetical protein